MSQDVKQKLPHKKWRSELKKQRRQSKRRAKAKQQISTVADSETDGTEDIYEESREYSLRLLAEEQWLERERLAQLQFAEKKRNEELEKKKREEEENRIKEEWEERQKKEKEEEAKKQELLEEKKKKEEQLLKDATANEKKPGAGPWSNPLAPRRLPGVERKIDKCPFFAKIAACRFGDRCSRLHEVPDTSNTLVFPGMYCHYSLDQALRGEYDIDVDLEYEDSDTTKHFEDFYRDVLPEFRNAGKVIQFKVCRNFAVHLKGNVYVQYRSEEEAMRAFALFNARWYGGRQLSGRFANIPSWRAAICGQYHHKKCIKGSSCNFLHVFLNPGNEFREADVDHGNRTDSIRIHSSRRTDDRRDRGRDGRSRSRSRDRSRRGSRSRDRTQSRARSRSRDRTQPRARSRSRDRTQSRARSRDRTQSRARSRSRDRTQSRARSRSRDRTQYRARSRSRDRTQSRAMSRSRDRTQSRARSRSRDRTQSRARSRSRDRTQTRARSRSRDRVQAIKRSRDQNRRTKSRSRSPSRKRSNKRSRSRDRVKTKSSKVVAVT